METVAIVSLVLLGCVALIGILEIALLVYTVHEWWTIYRK